MTSKNKPKFRMGDNVRITAKDHRWYGHCGRVVRFEVIKTTKQNLPVINLFEVCDHQFFLMRDSDAEVV